MGVKEGFLCKCVLCCAHSSACPAVVTMFSEYCAVPFEVEPVEVIDSFGESHGETWWHTYGLGLPYHFEEAVTSRPSSRKHKPSRVSGF